MKYCTTIFGLVLFTFLMPKYSLAQSTLEVTDDCIIRTFDSTFSVQQNASLDVVENLLVDCGTLDGKHGIFRILPTKAARPNGVYNKTPIMLNSITDDR